MPHTITAVIAGWMPGQGRRAGMIGAVLLAAYHGDALVYLGRIGTGFTGTDDSACVSPAVRGSGSEPGVTEASATPGSLARRWC